MINLHESMGSGPESAVRHASVVRHVTDCATLPCNGFMEYKINIAFLEEIYLQLS